MVPANPSRRRVLRTVAGGGLVAVTGCSALDASPSLSVPSTVLTDEAVDIEISGLDSRTSVLVRARARSRDPLRGSGEWEARARFEVDESGAVSVPEKAPVDGTYEGVDPMGLFWSMRPTGSGGDLPPEALFVPGETGYDVTLTADVDGERVAEATTTRRLFDPDIERRTVDRDDVVGEFYAPPGDDTVPGVVHLHGAGGRPHLATGRLLASRGFAALVLRYFGDPGPVPDTLTEVPLGYVGTAIRWLLDRDRVAGSSVGLVGFSRGGELALLLASRRDDVGAVVGWVPSGVVWEGLGPGRTPAGTSAWAVDGEPVPYLELAEADPGPPPTPGLPYFEPALSNADADDLAAATVDVEAADAPVLLVSVTDDRRWPSTALSERAVDRLDAAGYSHEYRHDRYRGAGHYIRLPFLPTPGTTRDRRNVYGGTPAANARASAGAWSATRSFLHDALGG